MILGHERQIQYFNAVLQRGRLAHAYLLYGPEHVGKFTIAKELAKALYCPTAGKETRQSFVLQNLGGQVGASCGACVACRAINANQHPSVIVLDRENTLVSKKDIRKEIPIEDIREVKRRFSFAASGDEMRVVIINGAEYLSIEAANAFLKLLEEPGAQTLCILIAHDYDALPPTIISRAQAIRFSLVPDTLLFSFIRDASLRDEAVRFAAGRPGILIRLLDDTETMKEERAFAGGVSHMLVEGIPAAFVWSEKIAADEALRKKAITYIVQGVRARLRMEGIDSTKRASLVQRLKEIDRIATIMATTNVNPRLALDMICIQATA